MEHEHRYNLIKVATGKEEMQERIYIIFYCKLCLKIKVRKIRRGITERLLKG